MSKNTVNTTATTTTNIAKGEKSMKKNATTVATTSTMTAQEFKQKSYDAYLVYVAFIEGKKSIAETVEALSPLMTTYGYTLTADNLANTLTVKMTAFGKDKGEVAKKVKSIATFRAFVKGGWKDVEVAPVHSNAGKNPAETKTTTKAKKPTKAEMEAKAEADAKRIAELEALLAAAQSTEKKAA